MVANHILRFKAIISLQMTISECMSKHSQSCSNLLYFLFFKWLWKKWIFQKCVFGASDLCRGRMVTLLQMECDCLASDTCINSHATINKPLAWQWPCLGKIPNLGSTSVKLCPWAISQSTWSAWQWWTVNSWKKKHGGSDVLFQYYKWFSAVYKLTHAFMTSLLCQLTDPFPQIAREFRTRVVWLCLAAIFTYNNDPIYGLKICWSARTQ